MGSHPAQGKKNNFSDGDVERQKCTGGVYFCYFSLISVTWSGRENLD